MRAMPPTANLNTAHDGRESRPRACHASLFGVRVCILVSFKLAPAALLSELLAALLSRLPSALLSESWLKGMCVRVTHTLAGS